MFAVSGNYRKTRCIIRFFHYKKFTGDKYVKDVLYTGNELVAFSAKDSSGTIFIPGKVNIHILYDYDYNLYSPVIKPDRRRIGTNYP